jgi:replicative DNA helicase
MHNEMDLRFANGVQENGKKANADEMKLFANDLRPMPYWTMIAENKLAKWARGEAEGYSTGFAELDKYFRLVNSEMITIAARPSMGKTTLATNILINMAEAGSLGMMFSIEMSRRLLGLRVLSSKSGLDSRRLSQGHVNDSDYKFALEWIEILRKLPILVADPSGLSITQLRSAARRHARKHSIRVLVIDYLQLMTGGAGRFENRNIETASISGGLMGIAKELSIRVFAVCQMSRSVEHWGRKDKRPMLSDLRDSGAIEQDADRVIFIHRPDKMGERTVKFAGVDYPSDNMSEIIVAKHRNGPTGSLWMRFVGETNRFEVMDFYAQGENHHEQSGND